MSRQTRAGAAAAAAAAAPLPGSRDARVAARDARRGITAVPDAPPQLPTTKKRPRKAVVAPEEAKEAPPQTPKQSPKKAKLETPQSLKSTRPSTPPQEAQPFLRTGRTENNERYFNASWGTKFLRSQAHSFPWVGEEVWAEHIPIGSYARTLDERVRVVEIDPGSGYWMNRCYGAPGDLALFHIVQKDVPTRADALRGSTRTPQKLPATYNSPWKRPHHHHPSAAAGPSKLDRPIRPLPSKPKAAPPVQHAHTLPQTTLLQELHLDQYFDSDQDAVEAAKTAALEHGFQLSIRHSKGKEKRVVHLGCYKGGLLPEERKKKEEAMPQEAIDAFEEAGGKVKRGARSSRMVGCPYALLVQGDGPGGKYSIKVVHGEHNHPLEPDIGLVKGNALTDQERREIEQARRADPLCKPLTLFDQLNKKREKRGEPLLGHQKIITNHLSREKAERHKAKAPLAVSLLNFQSKCKDGDLILRDRYRKSDGRLTGLFVTHQRVLPLLRQYDHLIGIDATYEMCKHDIKVVQFVTPLPWGSPQPLAFGLIEKEDWETYVWLFDQFKYLRSPPIIPRVVVVDNSKAVRKALDMVWPEPHTQLLLCHWHATQNVMTEAGSLLDHTQRKAFKYAWQRIVEAEFEYEADELWLDFAETYGEGEEGEAAIDYVSRCWRSPRQWDHIANCITKRVKHFGMRTTSIVESSHASLKSNMARIAQRRKLLIEELLEELIKFQKRILLAAGSELIKQRNSLVWQRTGRVYYNILGRISQKAFAMIKKEVEAARQALSDNRDYTVSYAAHLQCTADLAKTQEIPELDWSDHPTDSCILHSTHRLPCQHRLALHLDADESYEIADNEVDDFYFLPETLAGLGEADLAEVDEGPPYTQVATDFHQALIDVTQGKLRHRPLDHDARILRCAKTYGENVLGPQSDAEDVSDASDASSIARATSQPVFDHPLTPEKYQRKRSKAESKKALKRKPLKSESTMARLARHDYKQSRRCGHCKEFGHDCSQCDYTPAQKKAKYALWEEEQKAIKAANRKPTKKQLREQKAARREARKEARKAQRREDGLSSGTHTSDEASTAAEDERASPAALLARRAAEASSPPQPQPPRPRLLVAGPDTPPQGAHSLLYYAEDGGPPPVHDDDLYLSSSSQDEKLLARAEVDFEVADQVAVPTTVTNASFAAEEDAQTSVQVPDASAPEGKELLRQLIELSAPYASPTAKAPSPARLVNSAALAPSPSKVAAADALVHLQESAPKQKWTPRPPVPFPEGISLADFTKLIVKCEIPAEPNGNCGYDAIKQMLKMSGTAAVRIMLLEAFDSEKGREALPDLTEVERKRWKAKIYPKGVIPADKGRRLEISAPLSLYYSNWLTPVVVNRTERALVIGSVTSVVGWSTFLPASKADLSQPPEPPMGLIFKPNEDDEALSHWDGFEVNENQPLPPVNLGLWGNKAKEYCSRETHRYFHHYFQFYSRGTSGENDRCPCHWTQEGSKAVLVSTQIEIQEISDGEDTEIVVSSVDLQTGQRRTRARMAASRKVKEEEKKVEKVPVIKAEPVTPPKKQTRPTAPMTPLRLTRSVTAAAEAAKKAKEEEEKVEKALGEPEERPKLPPPTKDDLDRAKKGGKGHHAALKKPPAPELPPSPQSNLRRTARAAVVERKKK